MSGRSAGAGPTPDRLRAPTAAKEKRPGLAREPLVHFVLLAAVLFAVSALSRRGDDVIEVSREEIEWRILQVEVDRGTRLTDEERRLVEDAYIDERVLVREASALGLEADERIDDILVQKMLHVLSGDVIQPSDEELADYFAAASVRYRRPAGVTLDELVVAGGGALPRALADGAEPEALAPGAIVGHRVVPRLDRDGLARIFGAEAADSIFGADVGRWVDPYESVRGRHWFRVRERHAAETPPLDEVRDVVRMDWIAEQEERRLAARVAELRARYTVVVEDALEGSR